MSHRKFYESVEEFFAIQEESHMYLTTSLAVEVCYAALAKGLMILTIEGGIWNGQTFEAKQSCIWWSPAPPVTQQIARAANEEAVTYLRAAEACNAFILDVWPIDSAS